MRLTIFVWSTLLLPLKVWASCPDLATVTRVLPEIRDRLKNDSDEPLRLNKDFIVRHGEPSSAVDDLLAGNFEGYIIDRLTETMPGVCRYQLRDDRSSVRGHFILYQQ